VVVALIVVVVVVVLLTAAAATAAAAAAEDWDYNFVYALVKHNAHYQADEPSSKHEQQASRNINAHYQA
jgi:uncharacterized protein YxeA